MILMLHIVLGLATLAIGVAALLLRKKQLIAYQMTGLAGTIATGVVLVVLQPQALAHLCVSGLVFTVISLALCYSTVRVASSA